MNCPTAVAEAPRAMKTSMKPRMKRSEWTTVRRRTRERAAGSGVASSSNVRPVMNERYDGKSGRTHGLRNETTPARKATATESSPPTSGILLGYAYRARQPERHLDRVLELFTGLRPHPFAYDLSVRDENRGREPGGYPICLEHGGRADHGGIRNPDLRDEGARVAWKVVDGHAEDGEPFVVVLLVERDQLGHL